MADAGGGNDGEEQDMLVITSSLNDPYPPPHGAAAISPHYLPTDYVVEEVEEEEGQIDEDEVEDDQGGQGQGQQLQVQGGNDHHEAQDQDDEQDDDDDDDDDGDNDDEEEEYAPEFEPSTSTNIASGSTEEPAGSQSTLMASMQHSDEPKLGSEPSTLENPLDSYQPASIPGFGPAPLNVSTPLPGIDPSPQAHQDEATPVPLPNPTPADTTTPSNQVLAQPHNTPLTGAAPTDSTLAGVAPPSTPSANRLPSDRVGTLEDRINEDPRGDIDAWLALIDEYKKRDKHTETRTTYHRFFEVFPGAVEQWLQFAAWEAEHNDFYWVEQVFTNSILKVQNVQLWTAYLNYVRRRNNLTMDTTGDARKIVTTTYEFVLQNVGIDKDSGSLWQGYIDFIRSGPEQVGDSSWQAQQKMDTLRKAYQRAVNVPMQTAIALWKEYEAFELGLSKQTGRKILQEKSPKHMNARSTFTALQNLTRDLHRTTLPRLPPAPGFDGDVEYMTQVDIWKKWIAFEKDDPLSLKDDDKAAYHGRILFVYKQALMALRFWPEMWFDAAEFCYSKDLQSQGDAFLDQGITANPESCLLAFAKEDRVETALANGQATVVQKGEAVRKPLSKLLDALYELHSKTLRRESLELARIEASFSTHEHVSGKPDDDDDDNAPKKPQAEVAKAARLEAARQAFRVQADILVETISAAWIAVMRAVRRTQGKVLSGESSGGLRAAFKDARRRGRINTNVYIASALMEHHCYRTPVALGVFERGIKLYPNDVNLPLAFIQHLININDVTNARLVFETAVTRLSQKPGSVAKTKPLFKCLHDYESQYGELSQIKKLESRMQELFPEDSQLSLFSARFSEPKFDPATVRLIISPATQMKPKPLVVPTVPTVPSVSSHNSPRPGAMAMPPSLYYSPNKRPPDDFDLEGLPSRKIVRSQSPSLKGAAGRRLDAQKRSQLRQQQAANGSHSGTPSISGPLPPPPEVYRLMSLLPRPDLYGSSTTPFNPERMADLLRNVDLTKAQVARPTPSQVPQGWAPPASHGYQPQNPNFGYGH